LGQPAIPIRQLRGGGLVTLNVRWKLNDAAAAFQSTPMTFLVITAGEKEEESTAT
jgi:hypothetical protein